MKIILIGLLLIGIILLASGYYFYRYTIIRKPIEPIPDFPEEKYGKMSEMMRVGLQYFEAFPYELVTIQRKNGEKLYGYYFQSEHPTTKTVLAVHGYRSEGRREYASIVKSYIEDLQVNVLIVDDYAHGKSDGTQIGFGWFDRLDCIAWCEWLIAQKGENIQIALHGISMGAATILMAASEVELLPKQVKIAISDCGFTSMDEQTRHLGKGMNVPFMNIILPVTSEICKLLAKYSFAAPAPIKLVEKVKVPILFIHGTADSYVPTEMVHRLYNKATCEKKLLLIENARHACSYYIDSAKYMNAISDYIEKYLI
jgi:Prolyl oligopeptidase family.